MRFPAFVRLPCLLPVLVAALSAAQPDPRLQELLKQYPSADTNKDGILSFEEAQAYSKVIRASRKTSGQAVNDDGTTTPPSSVKKPAPSFANVSYGSHERNKLDLWLAQSDRPTPLVVYIHGGGFVNGSKDGVSGSMVKDCLDAGVSVMAINYRFRTSAPIQDILRDCARSIQFIRAKAKDYNLDPQRIASYGGSAGAGTSLWLAFHPDLADPKASDPVLRESSRIVAAGAINTQATYNVLRWPEFLGQPSADWDRPGEVPAFYGAKTREELDQMQAVLDDVDMLKLISADDPPVFMYSSQPDGELANRGHALHHPNHARTVKQTCEAAGVPATVWFGMSEPRLSGDYQPALRTFLLEQLGAAVKR